jgi:hypothetical protein
VATGDALMPEGGDRRRTDAGMARRADACNDLFRRDLLIFLGLGNEEVAAEVGSWLNVALWGN